MIVRDPAPRSLVASFRVAMAEQWLATLSPTWRTELAALLAGGAPETVVADWCEDHGGYRAAAREILYAED